ncbi:formylglycine-generating enzyme family protein [Flavitalea antarctica]
MADFDLYLTEIDYHYPVIFVEGTHDSAYMFGETVKVPISISGFYIGKYPVTQRLWQFILGTNPSSSKEENRPVENVSFVDITAQGGFLDRLNLYIKRNNPATSIYRLPSETEWEYAARGGVQWKDNYLFSGSNDITAVAWQGDKNKGTETHPVGQKLPNQLGIHDMSGNVWEWCQDYYQSDVNLIPNDGSPYLTKSDSRVLRGGCHHNWAIHCTVSKRYEIGEEFKDGCIGFRIATGGIISNI